MARLTPYIITGQPQHIIQRGNNRQVIFAANADYQFSAMWRLKRRANTVWQSIRISVPHQEVEVSREKTLHRACSH